MKFFFISDLHIKSTTTPRSEKWISTFCQYLAESIGVEPAYIFVLGDVIDRGEKEAFIAADAIFDYISSKVSPVQLRFRERVTSPYDVEWGTLTYAMTLKDLNYDYYLKSLSGADRELIRQMRDLRNNLAHGDYCSVSQVNDILSDRSSVPRYA